MLVEKAYVKLCVGVWFNSVLSEGNFVSEWTLNSEIFFIVTDISVQLAFSWVEATDIAAYFNMHRTALLQELSILSKMSIVPKLRNPATSYDSFGQHITPFSI